MARLATNGLFRTVNNLRSFSLNSSNSLNIRVIVASSLSEFRYLVKYRVTQVYAVPLR
jgi:hypothetical protein